METMDSQYSCFCDETQLPSTWKFAVKNMADYSRVGAKPLFLGIWLTFFLQPVPLDIPGCITNFTSSQSKTHAFNIVLLSLHWSVCMKYTGRWMCASLDERIYLWETAPVSSDSFLLQSKGRSITRLGRPLLTHGALWEASCLQCQFHNVRISL